MEVENKKHAENQLKMEKFHNLKCRMYLHAKLNISKSVIRSRAFSQAIPEELETALQKQEVKDYKSVTIRRNDETVQTYIFKITFNKKKKKIRIGYTVVRVEHYIPIPLRCFKCQKFGNHKDIYRGP